MPPAALYNLDEIDFDKPRFSLEDVRQVNPQRDEMEQLSAVVHIDRAGQGCVGYKDVTDHEFWVRGHMPGYPIMPGIVQCECAAQLAGFYAVKYDILEGDYIGFGGMRNVRFRGPVFPNCRLVLMERLTKLRPRKLAEFDFQGFVEGRMVFNGTMIGVPINRD